MVRNVVLIHFYILHTFLCVFCVCNLWLGINHVEWSLRNIQAQLGQSYFVIQHIIIFVPCCFHIMIITTLESDEKLPTWEMVPSEEYANVNFSSSGKEQKTECRDTVCCTVLQWNLLGSKAVSDSTQALCPYHISVNKAEATNQDMVIRIVSV